MKVFKVLEIVFTIAAGMLLIVFLLEIKEIIRPFIQISLLSGQALLVAVLANFMRQHRLRLEKIQKEYCDNAKSDEVYKKKSAG